MKPLVGRNPRDFSECDSVPEGRQDVATGESPWYAMLECQKSRRDDRNFDWVVSCRPFRTENHLCFLQPRAHARGYNLPPHSWLKRRFDSPRNAFHKIPALVERILHGVALTWRRAIHSRPLFLDKLLPVFQLHTLFQAVTHTTLAADPMHG